MQVHRPPARLLSFLLLHLLLPLVIVPLLSFDATFAGFRLRRDKILPGTWRNTRLKRNLNAAFVQRPFTAKMSYVDTKDCMDIQAIHLFDVSLLLLLLKLENLEGETAAVEQGGELSEDEE